MKEPIIRLLSQKGYVPSNVPELLRLLKLSPKNQQELQTTLAALEQAGSVARIKGNRYIIPSQADLIPGRIRITRQGKGFLIPDDALVKEVMIPESATSTALHEDRVLVRLDVKSRGLRDDEPGARTGSVIQILERRRTLIVGTLQRRDRFLRVIPDDPRIPHAILVPEPRDVGRPALTGDKVVVELGQWDSPQDAPEGEIVEVLGAPDVEGVDMLSVLRQYQLPLQFPKNVLLEARAYGSEITAEDLAGREDCRSHPVITIDPDDAKDFDDAICLERAGANEWKVWVHIADVSHYVKPGTELDEEARKRGNSTYLVDRVIPMLPEALSNELCSLKPNVDRLTKCVEFLISGDGQVLKKRFYPAVIHSQRRFTYREVLEIIGRKAESPIEHLVHAAHALAQKIRHRRFKAGALELDFPEMKIRLDDHGKILRIDRNENDFSHQLIEEYMLLANEAVAERLIALKRPAIHRVHEEPDAKRLGEYREEVLSHGVQCGNLQQRHEIQKLLHKLGTLPIGPALKIGFLKSLMRARYAVEPLGHYGLAKTHYTHFTSPIRRYSDLVVHRALFLQSHGSKYSLKEVCDHISDTERNSADAERDSKDVKLYAYLEEQLRTSQPQRYPALVTDVRNFGFFVDVTGLAMSGLVPLSTLEDDFYIFEALRNQLIGRRTRKVIRLGDRLEVQVAKIDRFKKQVDFRLAKAERGAARAGVATASPERRHAHFPRPPQSQSRSGPSRPLPSRPAQGKPRSGRPAQKHANEARPQDGRPHQGRPQPARAQSGRPQPGRTQAQPGRPHQSSRQEPARPQPPARMQSSARPTQRPGNDAVPQGKSMFSASSSSRPMLSASRPLQRARRNGPPRSRR